MPKLHPQIPLTTWNSEFSGSQFYETMSLMRTTKQNPKHNNAELDVTRTWISSQGIPSRGKTAKPKGGVVNYCRTSMKALMVTHFRHMLSENTAGNHNSRGHGPRWCEQLGHGHSGVWFILFGRLLSLMSQEQETMYHREFQM